VSPTPRSTSRSPGWSGLAPPRRSRLPFARQSTRQASTTPTSIAPRFITADTKATPNMLRRARICWRLSRSGAPAGASPSGPRVTDPEKVPPFPRGCGEVSTARCSAGHGPTAPGRAAGRQAAGRVLRARHSTPCGCAQAAWRQLGSPHYGTVVRCWIAPAPGIIRLDSGWRSARHAALSCLP
jgi:hypothetical protein